MQKVAILYDASQAVLSTFDLDEVLAQILAILRDYFNLYRGAILLLDKNTGLLEVRSQIGFPRQEGAGGLRIGQGITGTAAKLKRPIYAPDVSRDPRYVMSVPSTRAELAIPLMMRDEVVGVLDCQSDKENFFDPETIDLLTLFSTQASIALQNAHLYSREQRRALQLEAINRIAKETTSVLELRELLHKVCRHTADAFALDDVSILLLEEGRLVHRAYEGRLTLRVPEGAELPPGAGLCHRALREGRAIVENDVSAVPGYIAGFEETRSEMCVPLISFGETLGVMALESAQTGAFDPSAVRPLESVADICANAIQNARYFERVRQLAYVDGLTGIFNRRYFEVRILEEIERARRYEGSMSVLMVDIDKFKRLNDEFGHLLGDETLRQVTSIFIQHLRKVDIVCRYGGEEFAIIVPETAGESAVAVAEKLRRVVETWNFAGVPRPVTISIGVAEFPRNGATRDELVRAADTALYLAKQGGRNRVLSALPAKGAPAD
jgi:diguanylate cyclase (GGDEF)-like protein